jgi:hypothetical protein
LRAIHNEGSAATLARPRRAVRSWGPALTVSPGSVADSESAFAYGDLADMGDTLACC